MSPAAIAFIRGLSVQVGRSFDRIADEHLQADSPWTTSGTSLTASGQLTNIPMALMHPVLLDSAARLATVNNCGTLTSPGRGNTREAYGVYRYIYILSFASV